MGSTSRWLDVEVGADDICLNTLPSNICTADLHNDEELKLIVGDLGKGEERPRLKVFRGAMQISEITLPDLPLGVVSHYIHENTPHMPPVIAVGFTSCVYIYRDLKMFHKFCLPFLEISASEIEVWKQLTDPANHNTKSLSPLIDSLNLMPETTLSSQSRSFLSMTENQKLEYLDQAPQLPVSKSSEIVCITSMKFKTIDTNSASCLVIGSEDGEVFILDPQTFAVISQVKLYIAKRTPYQMIATGLYTVDYRITIATRERSVCIIKRQWTEGRKLFTCDAHIIDIAVTSENSVLVITTDHNLVCYSRKGKKQWFLYLEHRPVTLTMVSVVHLGLTLTAVALANGTVHLYDGKAKRDSLFVRDVASVMKFGQLGQEEHVFMIVTGSGNLQLKILKRTAEFTAHSAGIEQATNGSLTQKPWIIPKKSKLFLEQSLREKENAYAMHESFQHELNRLRLLASKTLLEAHMKSDNSIGVGALEPVRLSAEVEGLGPLFRVTLIIENTSSDKAVVGLYILFHVHTSNYKVANPYIKVPLLPPGGRLQFPTKIEEIFTETNPEILFRTLIGQGGERALVKVVLLKEGQLSPVLAATIVMPPTDPIMIPVGSGNDGD